MNTNLDRALNYIWASCQSEENYDRVPPDYTFSFARRYTAKLAGIISKDMTQSYVTAPERTRATHPYAYGLRRVDGHIPAQKDIVEVTGSEDDFGDVSDGDDRTEDMRHPDPTEHDVGYNDPQAAPFNVGQKAVIAGDLAATPDTIARAAYKLYGYDYVTGDLMCKRIARNEGVDPVLTVEAYRRLA